jgi:hypothetical protein
LSSANSQRILGKKEIKGIKIGKEKSSYPGLQMM